jgi:hypothetical protein
MKRELQLLSIKEHTPCQAIASSHALFNQWFRKKEGAKDALYPCDTT